MTECKSMRIMNIIDLLAGYAATGINNKHIAEMLGIRPKDVSIDIRLIIEKGWARQDEVTQKFYPTAAFTRLSFKVMADFEKLETQINDNRRNMTTG